MAINGVERQEGSENWGFLRSEFHRTSMISILSGALIDKLEINGVVRIVIKRKRDSLQQKKKE